ncbi:probable long-chain-alcohol O-fatty-acyltransferase 4 [Cornus florida]|uniref:probable long-chain-alcohol O-fatty-acyltransferase 4 n=1 Tax=Cornus florida TaxID=4283 RepID=UPI0028976D60|nr:probable long-chain-alcohol O-fatty-acyltransferase 4 [Cornus florida]
MGPTVLLLASLSYCYMFVTKIPKGMFRVFSLIPVFYFFSTLPWYFSLAVLRGVSAFFITWITSFKLILFCFNRGPLVTGTKYIDFVALSIFPLKIIDAKPASSMFFMGYEVVTLFNQPYLATSLQDFWGRRWNRMSSNILRLTVYVPTRETLTGIVGVGPAKVVALITTLVVSGVMHEVVFYYITCGMRPTWEVTWFFVLHGLCMVFESVFRAMGWSLPFHGVIAVPLTVGFAVITGYWLLVLPVWRSGQSRCM